MSSGNNDTGENLNQGGEIISAPQQPPLHAEKRALMQNSRGPEGADPDPPWINVNASTVADIYNSRADLGFQPSTTAPRPNLIGHVDNAAMLMAQSIADTLSIQQAASHIPLYDRKNI